MIVYDTSSVAERERFSYWVDTLGSSFFPFEAEHIADHDQPFCGRLAARYVGQALVARHSASRYILKRTKRAVAKREIGMVVLGIPRAAPVVQHFVDYPLTTASVGEAVIYDADQFLSVSSPVATDEESIFLPRDLFTPYLGNIADLAPRALRRSHALLPLILSTANAFLRLGEADSRVTTAATQVLVHLISVSHGLHAEADHSIAQSLQQARRNQAASIIAAQSHDPSLNASKVARYLGLSVRRLHALYEDSDTSVAKQILTTRLARAREMLVTRPQASVQEVAVASGFYSTSTFYRCFVNTFGLTPNAVRLGAGN